MVDVFVRHKAPVHPYSYHFDWDKKWDKGEFLATGTWSLVSEKEKRTTDLFGTETSKPSNEKDFYTWPYWEIVLNSSKVECDKKSMQCKITSAEISHTNNDMLIILDWIYNITSWTHDKIRAKQVGGATFELIIDRDSESVTILYLDNLEMVKLIDGWDLAVEMRNKAVSYQVLVLILLLLFIGYIYLIYKIWKNPFKSG